jgi:hypothetical protein
VDEAAKRVSFWLVRGAPGRRWLQRLAVINIERKIELLCVLVVRIGDFWTFLCDGENGELR